jgi:hypothetical protein
VSRGSSCRASSDGLARWTLAKASKLPNQHGRDDPGMIQRSRGPIAQSCMEHHAKLMLRCL